jgi:hemolysin activation/secretion protein
MKYILNTRRYRISISASLAAIALLFPLSSTAYSQPPQGGTAATDQVMRDQKKIERRMVTPPKKTFEMAPEAAPVEEGGQKFYVKKIELKGCESVKPEEFADIMKKYEGREVSMGELDAMTKEIEREYLKRGLITAVFIPPQEAKESIITIQVVEAKMGELLVEKPPFYNEQVFKRYWQISPGETLRYDKMSRSLQMMNKNPDREVKAALKAGKKPATTDVILTSKTSFPIHFSFALDNDGSISSGKYRTSLGGRNNNLLGLDDTLVAGTMFGDRFKGNYIYHNIPLTNFGTSLLYGASDSYSKPNKDYDQYDMRSYANNENMSIHQDIYRKDEYIGEVYMGFDFKDKVVYANSGGPDAPNNAGTINKDRLRVLSIGGSWIKRTSDSVLYISGEYDQGLRILGASPAGNPYASNDASSVYPKFLLNLTERSRLPLGLQINWKLRTQFAAEKLTPQEQFSLGGIDSVRGYPPSDYNADTAFLTSYELLVPAILIPSGWRMPYSERTLKEQTSGVLFVDYGYGQRRDSRRAKNMTGVGLGLRVNVYDEAIVRLEWGWPVGDKPITEAPRTARLHFSIDFQDRLPADIERIRKMNEESNLKKMAWKLVNDELARTDSPVRKKMHSLMAEADYYEKEDNIVEYRKVNIKILQLSNSLYRQAEDYLRSLYAHLDELREEKKLASQYEQDGNHDEAQRLWKKILSEGSPKPLTLSF